MITKYNNRKIRYAFIDTSTIKDNDKITVYLFEVNGNTKQATFNKSFITEFINKKFIYSLEINKNRKYICFYVLDIDWFHKILQEQENIQSTMTVFKHKNEIYSITLKSINSDNFVIIKDYYKFIPFTNITQELKIKYLKNLTTIILDNFKLNIHLKHILSLPSIALRLFRKISPEKRKLIKTLNAREDTFIRKAFFGGRTEIYEPYVKDNLYYYDVNSLYPYIMQNYKLPIGIPIKMLGEDINLKDFYGFVDVVIETPLLDKGILPLRDMKNSQLNIIYPNGTFRGVFFSEELKMAQDYGYKILHIYEGYFFKSEIIFDKFVKALYSLRCEVSDIYLKKIFKLIMNSLYGRFAGVFEAIIKNHNTEKVSKEVIKLKFLNVALSAAIAAYARCFMFNIIYPMKNDIVYWDTDGIIIKKPLNDIYINENLLGKFKLVAKIKEFAALATKFYIYTTIDNKFIPVLRGINCNDYLIKDNYFYEIFHKAIYNNTKGNKLISVDFLLINKETKKIINFSFTFGNKRKVLMENNKIKTQPWLLAKKIK